jgi:hypothetical protein
VCVCECMGGGVRLGGILHGGRREKEARERVGYEG